MYISPSLQDRFFISWKHSIIFTIATVESVRSVLNFGPKFFCVASDDPGQTELMPRLI